MKTICVVPARKGSRRCKGKNFRPFADTTLIDITINQAKRIFEDIIVTTDTVNFDARGCMRRARPAYLATDNADMTDVVKDAVEFAGDNTKTRFDAIVLLQVTSPLRTDEDVEKALELFDGDLPVISVSEVKHSTVITSMGAAQYNGAVYVFPRHDFKRALFTPYYMPIERSIDIDTEFEFKLAEFAYGMGQTSN